MKTRIAMIIAMTITAAALLIGLRVRKHINGKPMEQSYNPNATPVSPSQAPYNPFDEFSHNEFVQTEFDGNL